jgi:cysteinyl-tRNA synthetase
MSENTLGETFDIHGGGLDLIFPHHENEIAQSVCAHDGRGPEDFARYWLHNGMLTVGGAKMAKSEGNFVTVRDALSQAPGEVIRLALLMTHYRDPLDWTDDRLYEARQTLDRWYRALAHSVFYSERTFGSPAELPAVPLAVAEALDDDLNTPLAISHLQEIAGAVYRSNDADDCERHQNDLRFGANLLGLLCEPASLWLRGGDTDASHIEERIAARTLARKERRFADADRVRDELAAEGILLEDGPQGTTWRKA